MTLSEPLIEMDVLVAEGKFHEAVERYFAQHGKATSPGDDFQANNKEEKQASLSHFLQHIKHINHITLHSQDQNGPVSESAFTFHFTDHLDNPLVWHEIIRRHWDNGLVVLEEYVMMEKPAETSAPAVAAAASQKAAEPAEQKSPNAGAPETGYMPAGKTESAAAKTTTTAAKNSASPAPAAKEAKKATRVEPAAPAASTLAPVKTAAPKKAAAVKPDDLKKIEGIGPKIEELLKKAGLNSFSELSAAPAEKLKGVLDAAGPRFQMHDPATWAKQAKLAADGEWEKLKTWQDELKGGIVK